MNLFRRPNKPENSAEKTPDSTEIWAQESANLEQSFPEIPENTADIAQLPDNNRPDPDNKWEEPENKWPDPENKWPDPENNWPDPDNKREKPDNNRVDPENNRPDPENNRVLPVEPLKPLVAGAFLGENTEIVEVLERGAVNFYRANAGGWGENQWKTLAERAATSENAENAPEAPIFPRATRWIQNGREYASWDWAQNAPFSEFRARANDEILLELLQTYAHGLESLEKAGLKPEIELETLSFTSENGLQSLGFFESGTANALQNLERFARTLARGHLAANATIRLDDEWAALPFSQEIKDFARALNDGKFADISQARAWLEGFGALNPTRTFAATDVGMQRDHNEDAVWAMKWQNASQNGALELEILAVADGMGGHEAGEVASKKALETLQKAILTRGNLDWQNNEIALGEVAKIIEEINNSIVEMNGEPPFSAMRSKPGTTLVFALKIGARVFIGNVGDSRAYRWNARNGLEKLTRDHSYVQDLLDAGRISEEQAWNHPEGNVITSHIGMARGGFRDVFLRLLQSGDTLLVVSDGVVDTLRDAQIEEIVAAQTSPKSLCQALIEAANEAGGTDNISVAALFCE